MTTITCTRRGCGKSFDPENNEDGNACQFHPEGPLFHEGLKSWNCCTKINRGVTDFNDFLAIKGCTTGTHSSEPLPIPPKPIVVVEEEESSKTPNSIDTNGKEIYGQSALPLPLPPAPTPSAPSKPVSSEYIEEQDDPEILIVKGTTCKRRGCGISYDGEARENEICSYHPGSVSILSLLWTIKNEKANHDETMIVANLSRRYKNEFML